MSDESVQTDTLRSSGMKATSYAEQYSRQRISDTWEPSGFQRYGYQRALLHEMPELGGPTDQLGGNPERYRPTSSCQDSLECQCGRDNV